LTSIGNAAVSFALLLGRLVVLRQPMVVLLFSPNRVCRRV